MAVKRAIPNRSFGSIEVQEDDQLLNLRLPLLVGILSLSVGIHADDGSWTLTGQGGTVMPLQPTQVRMVSETVTIRPAESLPNWSVKNQLSLDWCYRWTADCSFRFQNASESPADILMGFPDSWVEDSWRWEFYDDQDAPKIHAIRGFETWVDGEPVGSSPKEPDPAMKKDWPKISRVLTWMVHFEPGQTREVRNRYRFGGGEDKVNSGDRVERVEYVLQTGALWKGPIGSAEIRVYPGKDWRLGPAIECWGGDWVHLVWRHGVVAPCGFKLERDPEPCFSWSLRNFVPREDIQVCLVTGALKQLGSPDEGDVTELRMRKNTIFAALGRIFKDPALRTHFDGLRSTPRSLGITCRQVPRDSTGLLYQGDDSLLRKEYEYTCEHWYTPNPAFKDSDLTPCEWKYVMALDKRIADLEATEKPSKKKDAQDRPGGAL
jgi:hypothetical protein